MCSCSFLIILSLFSHVNDNFGAKIDSLLTVLTSWKSNVTRQFSFIRDLLANEMKWWFICMCYWPIKFAHFENLAGLINMSRCFTKTILVGWKKNQFSSQTNKQLCYFMTIETISIPHLTIDDMEVWLWQVMKDTNIKSLFGQLLNSLLVFVFGLIRVGFYWIPCDRHFKRKHGKTSILYKLDW